MWANRRKKERKRSQERKKDFKERKKERKKETQSERKKQWKKKNCKERNKERLQRKKSRKRKKNKENVWVMIKLRLNRNRKCVRIKQRKLIFRELVCKKENLGETEKKYVKDEKINDLIKK